MRDKNNDFLNSLKVEETSNKISSQKTPLSQRDQYTCLKLISDTSKIFQFIRNFQKQYLNKENSSEINKSPSASSIYYNSVNTEIGFIESDFREGKISNENFRKKLDDIWAKYEIDFENLINVSDKITLLTRYPNKEDMSKLYEQLQTDATKYFDNRNNNYRE